MTRGALALLLVLLIPGCSTEPGDPARSGTSPSKPTATDGPSSLPALFETDVTGGDLRRVSRIDLPDGHRRHRVTYRSGDLTVSGVLDVPSGAGPFPAVVLNHGYVRPDEYVTGQGMERERDHLVRAGFVVLHVDYRGHARTDFVSGIERELWLGYAQDSIAGVKALRELPEVRSDQVAMAGRSLGGGVTFNALVIDPEVVDAAVVWSSASTRYIDYFRRWTRTQRPAVAREIVARWGTIGDNPAFWAGVSSRTYADRIEAAVMMHHGTRDERCPFGWAEATRNALRNAGVELRFHAYRGERHVFSRDWRLSMRRTVEFLRAEMGVRPDAVESGS
jgi:dipeptidyl aminopeptidase/acylaminoacyl peptidase